MLAILIVKSRGVPRARNAFVALLVLFGALSTGWFTLANTCAWATFARWFVDLPLTRVPRRSTGLVVGGRMRSTASFVFSMVLFSGLVTQAETPNGSVIVAEGFAAANNYAGTLPDFFEGWCADTEDGNPCIPTVTLDVFEPKKVRRLGAIHAWGKDFRATVSGTLQFKEFVLYDLEGGQLYTLSQPGGHPGGAFADPSLVIPKHGDVVLLGGAEGLVVGGTGKYRTAGGAYSTRLKLETIGGIFAYYDELLFRFREVDIQ
jgi:hypothetical protein